MEFIIKKIAGVLASLLAATLWQLACHFLGWITAPDMPSALKAGILTWGMLLAFTAIAELFNQEDPLDLVLLIISGGFAWLALQLLGIPDKMNFFGFGGVGVVHYLIAYLGKRVIFLKKKTQ